MSESKLNFMVVDDDSTSNMISKYAIKRFFKDAFIFEYTDPKKALSEINMCKEKGSKTLLFLDINMPEISGWDFLDIFKNFDTTLTTDFIIYILSSSVEKKDFDKADTNPLVSGFLVKPLSKEAMAVLASKYLDFE